MVEARDRVSILSDSSRRTSAVEERHSTERRLWAQSDLQRGHSL